MALLILKISIIHVKKTTALNHKSTDYSDLILENEGIGVRPLPIEFGQTVSGIWTQNSISKIMPNKYAKYFTFYGFSGQSITINLTGDGVDAVIFLLDPDENALDYKDNSRDGINSRISKTLSSNGAYKIEAICLTSIQSANSNTQRKSMDSVRESVIAVAEPALRSWLNSMSLRDLDRYGWSSNEVKRAKLLTPIPYYMPSRLENNLDRNRIEETLDQLPLTWLVPVTNGSRILSLITVETQEGKPPKAVEFGKSFTANRLDAGIRALKELSIEQWRNLRFLGFVSPTIDLLLFRNEDGVWRWFNLTGTYEGKTTELDANSITRILNELRKAPPLDWTY